MSSGATSPRRNRVTPDGEIVAIPLRGAWTGNRGLLHRGFEIVRPWASHHWLVCALEFKGWHQIQWQPNRLTWLFFHDEAVAFAAGHRPCALCRRVSYNAYRDVLSTPDSRIHFDDLDRRLHGERLVAGTRRRQLHEVAWPELVDGAFVVNEGTPMLVSGRELVSWSPGGYGSRSRRPKLGTASMITPPSTFEVLRTGYYPVQIDESARS